MSPEELKKYIAQIIMNNYIVVFYGINKETRKIDELYLAGDGSLTTEVQNAAYFSDTMSAFMFLRTAPAPCPVAPESHEIVPHSTFYRCVTVDIRYRDKNEQGEYKADVDYNFTALDHDDGIVGANGAPTYRVAYNNMEIEHGKL